MVVFAEKKPVGNRIYRLDNIKVLVLFLVVLGHFIELYLLHTSRSGQIVYTLIYTFHMPAVLVVSGYLSRRYRSYDQLLKRFASLLVPTLMAQSAYSVLTYINTGKVEVYWILWYTLALLVWDILLEGKKTKLSFFLLLAMILIMTSLGAWSNLLLGRFVYMFPFYLLGKYLPFASTIDRYRPLLKGKLLATLLALPLVGIGFYLHYIDFNYALFYFSGGAPN